MASATAIASPPAHAPAAHGRPSHADGDAFGAALAALPPAKDPAASKKGRPKPAQPDNTAASPGVAPAPQTQAPLRHEASAGSGAPQAVEPRKSSRSLPPDASGKVASATHTGDHAAPVPAAKAAAGAMIAPAGATGGSAARAAADLAPPAAQIAEPDFRNSDASAPGAARNAGPADPRGHASATLPPDSARPIPPRAIEEMVAAAGTAKPDSTAPTTTVSDPASRTAVAVRVALTVTPPPAAAIAPHPPAPRADVTAVSRDTKAAKSVAVKSEPAPAPEGEASQAPTTTPVGNDARSEAEGGGKEPPAAPRPHAEQTMADVPRGTAQPAPAAAPATATSAVAATYRDPVAMSGSDAAEKPGFAALAAQIAARSLQGSKMFDIRLDPPELGRVEVRLTVADDGKTQALLTADRPHTLDLLQRGSHELERALKDAGLDLSNNSLNFSLKGEERQGEGGGASTMRPRSLPSAVVARAEAANASEPQNTAAPGSGRLDIHV